MDNRWTGVPGQHKLKFFFDSLIDKKNYPQAIIINGLKGTGKDFIASRFAAIINEVPSSKYIDPFSQVFLKHVFPLPRGKNEESFDDPYEKLSKDTLAEVREKLEAKNTNPFLAIDIHGANEIKINSIRDILKFLSLTSGTIRHKTVLISNAELMNEEAQNSLLKQIEEPPPNTTFLLTTDSLDSIRETIKSRCWILNSLPYSAEDMLEILTGYFKLDVETANTIIPFCEGSVFQAQQLMEKDIKSIKTATIEYLRFALANKINSAFLHLTQNVMKEEQETILLFLKMLILWLADAQNFKNGCTNLYYNDFSETFAKFHSRYNIESFQPYIIQIEQYSNYLRNNNLNLNVLFLNLTLMLASIIQGE
ncbi:MAG: hypothetical protein LWX56_01230 [Ignavibacteria bacterium]|nr:hypothetical protein [Ignavibacteria bacterium]